MLFVLHIGIRWEAAGDASPADSVSTSKCVFGKLISVGVSA
ncbi:hypothetical protein ACFY4C_41485 [Actinomadura viridis]